MIMLRPLVFLLAVWLLCNLSEVSAERYLTSGEVRKILFPTATRFEERTFHFKSSDISAIQKASGIPVKNLGNRVILAFLDEKLLGVVILDYVLGKHELIDYAVAISPEGKVIQTEILEYRESHGGEVRGAKWREQFVGKSAADKLRLNADIYNISGATISCRNVTDGIKRLLATYNLVVHPALVAARELPPATSPAP